MSNSISHPLTVIDVLADVWTGAVINSDVSVDVWVDVRVDVSIDASTGA